MNNEHHETIEDIMDAVMLEESEPSREALVRWSTRYPAHRDALARFFVTWAVQEEERKETAVDEARVAQYLASHAASILARQEAKETSTSRNTPIIPPWIRAFMYPGYTNVYSLSSLQDEPKLFCTETLFGDWNAPTLLLAKDAAPANVIRARVERGDPDPWRHGLRGRDPMGYQTNEGVAQLAPHFAGTKLYGSALAHMLKEDDRTSGSLADFSAGRLHEHLKRVLEFVIQNMPNVQAIVCLGNEAHRLVLSCLEGYNGDAVPVGGCVDAELFKRPVLIGRLYHPSRAFQGGWNARHREWKDVAAQVNKRIGGPG